MIQQLLANARKETQTIPTIVPTVTVVVVSYNRKLLLAQCLRSLRLQQGVQSETVVVDNGSSDGTAAMLAQEFPEVHLISNSTNLGFCQANNQGIAYAKSPIVALLNNDAEAEPGWLGALIAPIQADPNVAMAASKILQFEDPSIIDKVGHLIYWDGQNRGRGMGERDRGQFEMEEEILWPDGCAAAYRRDALLSAGGFDNDFFAYADDADLGFRLRLAGYTAQYAPKAVVRHHRGSTLGKTNPIRLHLIERNRLLLAIKLFPLPLLLLNPLFYALRLAYGFWSAIRNKGEAGEASSERGKLSLAATLLKADIEALSMLPQIWEKRRAVKRFQKLTSWQVIRLMWRFRISLRTLLEGGQ